VLDLRRKSGFQTNTASRRSLSLILCSARLLGRWSTRSRHSVESQSMDIRPLHDRLIVRRLEDGEQTIGGIIIPDTAKEKPQQGKVIAAGKGKVNEDGKRIPLDVKAGDLILFGKYTSQEVKLHGEEYLIMREDEVLAVIDGSGTKKKK
jgi:chaperonin GroES